ncbi:MAG: phosphoglucosamine mutase [Puniceicoccaceae bacterium]|nr:MAG: phosphoglucosamine mutase [Puniceicoccaceae bacterium]
MSRRYFGTDGVRGPYGGPRVNEAFFARLAAAAGRFFREEAGGRLEQRVYLGRDTRESGPALEAAVAAGLRRVGLEPVSLGVLPTPAVSLACLKDRPLFAIMLSASHNPAADNGLKLIRADGFKLTDAEEVTIEGLLDEETTIEVTDVGGLEDLGAAARAYYREALAARFPNDLLRGWRVVVDAAHGAAAGLSSEVLARLGAEVIAIANEPDGARINNACGSQHPEGLVAAVRAHGARAGLAHDGDADRLLVCGESGALLDGDAIMAALALDALEREALPGRTLVATEQSNLGLDRCLQRAGGRVLRTPVGDRYVAETMRAGGFLIGGESSGHLILMEQNPSADGLGVALAVFSLAARKGVSLEQLAARLERFPAYSLTLPVVSKPPLDGLAGFSRALAGARHRLGSTGRVLARYSGTEPCLRLHVEAQSAEEARLVLDLLVAAARGDLSEA